MVTFWLLDSKVWGVIVVNKRLCILTQQAMKTHDMIIDIHARIMDIHNINNWLMDSLDRRMDID